MNESDYEEEEILVFADFKNHLMPRELADPKVGKIKMIGLESENPIAEINGHIFKGTYDFAMGTNVFFEKDDMPATDPLFEETCRQNYKYFNKTTKVINFQRVFMEPNKTATTESNTTASMDIDDSDARDNEILKIDHTYEEAIRQFPSVAKND